ncbi:mediator of RNA polymerase II transcription subunit 14-like [Watersipora subatra]|uniref:mediator of RNA polymerase II transcription subunit 14-like n=1 Tax=Watersipora subatra TaxID=2589382 RepID=UPI00355BCE79
MDGQMVPNGAQQGNIALSTVIDFSLQKAYHELMVLSELLPRKTDMERKMEIVQYAYRTRQLFIRVLALVKWAKNGCKIDQCMAISNYLDQQAMLYIDTADRLSKLARGTLVQARLPSFSIPVAVDVLTSGTYPRLPSCIRDKIIPPDPITTEEETSTLKRLTQIIEYRLVTSDIPRAFKQLTAYNGRVKLLVDKEFSATLTVMGDYLTLPWRLLGIEILVEDLDSRDGKPLVHDLQIDYLHTLVQSRLVDTETPLHELYTVLHSFCQSLQLEVLYSQAQKLIHEQLNSSICIEKYIPCKRLIISYWRPRGSTMPSQHQQSNSAVYKIDIHVNESDVYKPLSIDHTPSASRHVSCQLPYALKSNQLSIEKILLETVHAWSHVRLNELEHILRDLHIATDFVISDLPPTLTFKIIKPCMETECVRIAVDCQQGSFLVSMAQLGDCSKVVSEIQQHLNLPNKQQKPEVLKGFLHSLKLWIGMERCRSSIQYIRTLCQDKLPFVQADQHPVSQLGSSVLYVKVPLQESLYVVVVVDVTDSNPLSLQHRFYLLPVSPCTYTDDNSAPDIPRLYMKPGPLTRLDNKSLVHAHSIQTLMEVNNTAEEMESSRSEESCYFVSELVSVVSQCELRAEFVSLAEHLTKEGIAHQGLQDEEGAIPCRLTLLGLPTLYGEADELLSTLLQVTIRVNLEHMHWVLEYIFSKNPVSEEGVSSYQCIQTYDMKNGRNVSGTVDEIIKDWKAMVKLYNLCTSYSRSFAEHKQDVKLYKFAFKSLQLAYGPSKNYLVGLSWQGDRKPNGDRIETPFEVAFTVCSTVDKVSQNPHTLTAHFLEELINSPGTSLAQFMQVLCDTVRPLAAIQKLPDLVLFGLHHSSPKSIPHSAFTVLAQSATFIKISYRQMYLIDITICDGERVLVRDGAYGTFDYQRDRSSHYTTAQGFKAFLANYEETEQSEFARSQSIREEDHPPTPSNMPAAMDTLEALFSAPSKPSPPTVNRQDPSPKPTFPSANSPAVDPLGGFGSPLDIQMTSPALPMSSPATMPSPSPSSNILAASPGLHFHPHGLSQNLDSSQTFPNPSPKGSWLNSPAPVSGSYTLSPRAGNLSQATISRSPHDTMAGAQGQRAPLRSGYVALPTVLSHNSLTKIMTPTSIPPDGSDIPFKAVCCPLERFLGAAHLKRHLLKVLTSDVKERVTMVQAGLEPGTVCWTSDSLQYKVSMDTSCQFLQLSVTPVQQEQVVIWTTEETLTFEKFFSHRVVSPPFKQNNVLSFCRMTSAPAKIVKDFIRIINKQFYPDPVSRWNVEWCLTIPHDVNRRRLDKLETGVGAMIVQADKIFYVLKFTRNTADTTGEPFTQFTVPFVYEMAVDQLEVAEKASSNRPDSAITQAVINIVQSTRLQQANYQLQQHTAIFASCQDIMNRMNP